MKKLLLLAMVLGLLMFKGIVMAGAPEADIKQVATNPYSYEGKVVNLSVYFQKTISRGTGVFLTGYMDLFSEDGIQAGQVVISEIPTDIIFEKGSPGWTRPYLITVKGLGLTHGTNAFGGPISAPHFKFIKIDWETAKQKNDQIIRRKQTEEEARIREQERIEKERVDRWNREEAEREKTRLEKEKWEQEHPEEVLKQKEEAALREREVARKEKEEKVRRTRLSNPSCPEYYEWRGIHIPPGYGVDEQHCRKALHLLGL